MHQNTNTCICTDYNENVERKPIKEYEVKSRINKSRHKHLVTKWLKEKKTYKFIDEIIIAFLNPNSQKVDNINEIEDIDGIDNIDVADIDFIDITLYENQMFLKNLMNNNEIYLIKTTFVPLI